jgi:integrase
MKQQVRDGVFQRKDTAGWYASYIDANGIRRKRRVQAHTRTQAVDALHALKTKVQTEKVLGVRHVSDMTTDDLLTRYKRHQKTRVAPSTFERIDSILGNLRRNLPLLLKEITRVKVAEFVATRSQEVAPASVHKEIATLKHALRMAIEWELIHNNTADRVKLPRLPEGRTRYLSPTELRSVLDAAPDWMRPPIALAAFTGMRRGELLKLRWRDVDLDARRAFLHETKNGSLRILALNDLAVGVFVSLPQGEPADLVLPDVDPARLSVYTRRLFVTLKIEGASFHSLRHTAASWLVMGGVDLYAVGKVLGHRTPRMTERYAHLSPQYMANAVSKLDEAFGPTLLARKGGTSTGLTLLQMDAKAS